MAYEENTGRAFGWDCLLYTSVLPTILALIAAGYDHCTPTFPADNFPGQ